MARNTKTKAWDELWRNTEYVTLISSGLPQTDSAKTVVKALNILQEQNLSVGSIDALDHLVRKAYDCGKYGSIK